jgi:hypothetical protein
MATNASKFNYESFGNETLKRLFKKLVGNLGIAATNDSEHLKTVIVVKAILI